MTQALIPDTRSAEQRFQDDMARAMAASLAEPQTPAWPANGSADARSRELRAWADAHNGGGSTATPGQLTPGAPQPPTVRAPMPRLDMVAVERQKELFCQQMWALRTALAFAVIGAILGIVWLAGNFGLGVIDCYWNADDSWSRGSRWTDCRTPDWRWRAWPLVGSTLCILFAAYIIYLLWERRNGPVENSDTNSLQCARICGVVLMLVGPATLITCCIYSCFNNRGYHWCGQFPRTNWENSGCCTPTSDKTVTPPCLWQYLCFSWSELLLSVAGLSCFLGVICKPRPFPKEEEARV